MKISTRLLLCMTALSGCAPLLAQTATVKVPTCLQVQGDTKYFIPCTGVVPVDSATGNALRWSDLLGGTNSNNDNPTTKATGAASTIAQPVQNADGSKLATDAQLATTNDKLTTLTNTMGTPFQAGASIGNTSFGATQNGTWNVGLVGTPTVNIGSMPAITFPNTLPAGSATSAKQDSLLNALGVPFQAGGAIANTSFGATQSGTWTVGIAGTPTVNIGSMPTVPLAAGSATSAKQDTLITTLGTPFQAGGTIANTNFGAKLQDASGAAFGTVANPVYVTGNNNGSSTPTGTAGTPTASVISVQGVNGGVAQTISGTVTANIGLTNGLALDTSVNNLFKTGQTIGNTSFGISGTLPAFAATPTFNLGTAPLLNVAASALPLPTGAATATNQTTANTSLAAIQTSLTTSATSAKQDALLAAVGNPVQANTALSNVIQAVATDFGAVVGTVALPLMPANAARKGWSIQNQSTTASCYVNGTTTATPDYHSLLIGPGGYYEPDHHVGTGVLSIICTAAATSVYARSW